jgi:hypothetical protein
MNALDIVRYGHLTMLGALEGCTVDEVETPGACGLWTVKDIVAHLASYEQVLIGILDEVAGKGPNADLNRFRDAGVVFNDGEVAARIDQGFDDVLGELNRAHEQVLKQLASMEPAQLSRPGTVPWYGDAYALDDLLVYMYYGHKREHAAQVAAFSQLARSSG